MRNGITFALVPEVLLVLALSPPSSAHEEGGTYDLAATPFVSFTCTDCVGTGVNLGGFTFLANLETPVGVDIADAGGGLVSFTVCQDWNGAICGETGEPNVKGCGTHADLYASPVPFSPARDTRVFVRVAQDDCLHTATSGRITMIFAP